MNTLNIKAIAKGWPAFCLFAVIITLGASRAVLRSFRAESEARRASVAETKVAAFLKPQRR